jgi:hypothetical protein
LTILSMWARNIDSRSRTAKQLRFKSALVPIRLFQIPIPQLLYGDFCNTIGTLLPRANPAACPQLAKADFASSSQHVRKGQRIAELEAEIEELQRQASALGEEPTADSLSPRGRRGCG